MKNPSPYLLLTLASLFWAGNWVVGRAMRNDIPPVGDGLLALGRCVADPPAVCRSGTQAELARSARQLVHPCAAGSLGATLFNTMIYVGLQYTAATNGVLFNSVTPSSSW